MSDEIRVGFACIPLGLHGPAPNRTCRLGNATDARLRELIAANVESLERCVDYVAALGLGLFRISSDLIPFGSHSVNRVPWSRLWASDLERIGRKALRAGIRLSMHPGQYTLLSSPDEGVTRAAVADLAYQAGVLEALGQPASAKLVIHGGGVYDDKPAAVERFTREYRALPAFVRERLVLENDERCYGAEDVLWIGEALGIPVVFDRFHHRVNTRGDDAGVSGLLRRARATWRARDGRQKVHFSSQQVGGRPGAHGYSIDAEEFSAFLEEAHGLGPLDIMIEAKGKEEAALLAARLAREHGAASAGGRRSMKARVFVRRQLVKRPLEEVFAFFDRPENLALLTPPAMRFRLAGAGGPMRQGATIDYTLKVLGVPLRWTSTIATYDPPGEFCDVQTRGPYASWAHVHKFQPVDGGTLVCDEVVYELPFGPLGDLAAPFVSRELKRIFDFRRDAVEKLFGCGPGRQAMKIVIAGSTGFIGRALTAALTRRGDAVAALTRRSTDAEIARALEGADAVVNLAGENIAAGRWTPARKRAILESRVNRTRALARAIRACTVKPRVLVNASAVGYYGTQAEAAVDENSPKGTGFLADVCADWEAEAAAAQGPALRVVRLRLGVVLGRGGGALPKMALPFRLFAGGPLGSGEQWVPWIHLDDAVGSILHAVDAPSLSGPVNAVAPECPRQKDFARALGRALHRPSWAPAPAFALKLALGEMSQMLLGGQRAVPKKLLESGYAFKRPALGDALENSL